MTRRLGVGGQGTVFLGHDPDGTAVAVKMLHARLDGDARARARFGREIEAARRVASFRTARVLAADLSGDTPYLVGEFIDGPALSDVVRDGGPMAGDDLHGLAAGTATALVAIHEAGVVHRDLKPSTILLGPLGPRVVDFGIAKAMDATSTTASQVMGTPAYMSPEQVGGDSVGPASDVFSFGATLVFAATGRPPFGQDTVPAVFDRVLTKEPDLGALAWSRQVSSRPIKAGSIEVAADDAGITARIDDLPLRWAWNEIEQVTVRPLTYSWLWGSLDRFCGVYAAPAPGAPPLGRGTAPHVDEATDLLKNHAQGRWASYR